MEKEPQPESLSTVTIKPEYPPSEVYSSEPPPAYHRPQSAAVQVAKIVAVTVVLVSVVLGSFILASAYVSANASCRQLEQELELLSEAADRFQPPPQPEALIQEAPIQMRRQSDILQAEEPQKETKDIETNSIDNDVDSNSDSSDRSSESSESNETEEEERTPIHFKLPLQLDFDDLAGALIEKNQRSRMNCIVEKKRAEEVVDHQPKTIRLPFGVNLTTDPRFERLSGERMIIVCESGQIQKAQPPPQPQPEEEEEDTIMIQPVMIPIPHTPFQTHMPQQMQPMVQQQEPQGFPMRPPMNHMHPMETMRPPMPPMMQPQVQIQPQPQPQPQPQQNEFPPNPILHHIVQQIIAQKIMETEKAREEQQQQQQQQQLQQQHLQQQQQQQPQPQPHLHEMHTVVEPRPQHRFQVPQPMVEQRFPIPEEVLTQLNRLPNRDVIVAVSEPESDENSEEVRFVQEQRQNAAEMNGRQAYARGIPVHIPVQMMTQDQEQEQESEQEPQAVASEEPRPHFHIPDVQPRSVRSVDALLKKDQKRVKRCACDCAC